MTSAQEKIIVDSIRDLFARRDLKNPQLRFRYFIYSTEVASLVKDPSQPCILGRLDTDNPKSCGIQLPLRFQDLPGPNGKPLKGVFSRNILEISDGILTVPMSSNRVWITSDKRLFDTHTDIDIWNVDTQRDNSVWHGLHPEFWRDGFLLFAWFATRFLGVRSDVITIIGKMVMADFRKSLTLQPLGSQIPLSPGTVLYAAICNYELCDPGVVRVVIDYVNPLNVDEQAKLDSLLSLFQV